MAANRCRPGLPGQLKALVTRLATDRSEICLSDGSARDPPLPWTGSSNFGCDCLNTALPGYRTGMDDSDGPLHALFEERELLIRCLDALEETRIAVERADLALATALVAARYENVLADAFYPQIVDSLGTLEAVDHGEDLLAITRTAIAALRGDMRGVEPISAHVSDPEGLEEDIDSMTASLRSLLAYEDDELFKLVEQLKPEDVAALRARIDVVSAHQTTLPDPPNNAVMRKLAEVAESITTSVHDRSTAWNPGIDGVLNGSD